MVKLIRTFNGNLFHKPNCKTINRRNSTSMVLTWEWAKYKDLEDIVEECRGKNGYVQPCKVCIPLIDKDSNLCYLPIKNIKGPSLIKINRYAMNKRIEEIRKEVIY